MKKKVYIIPRTNVMIEDSECLLAYSLTSTTEGIKTDEDSDMSNDDNRSRRTYSVWEEE